MQQLLRQLVETFYALQWFVEWLNKNEGAVAGVAAAIAISALAVTIWYENKNFKMRGLNLVFEKSNNTKARDARRNILSAYARYLELHHHSKMEFTVGDFWKKGYPTPDLEADQDIMNEFPSLREDMEMIKSDLEEIAVMEHNGMISRTAYLDAYWGSMLRCLPPLTKHIENSRKLSGSEHFTIYYPKLCRWAIVYWWRHDLFKKSEHKSTIRYWVAKNKHASNFDKGWD